MCPVDWESLGGVLISNATIIPTVQDADGDDLSTRTPKESTPEEKRTLVSGVGSATNLRLGKVLPTEHRNDGSTVIREPEWSV